MPHRDKLRMVLDRAFTVESEAQNSQKIEVSSQASFKLSSGEALYLNGILDQSPGSIDVKVEGNIAVFTEDEKIAQSAPVFPPTQCARFLLMRPAGQLEKSNYEKEYKQEPLVFEELVLKGDAFEKTGQTTKYIPR